MPRIASVNTGGCSVADCANQANCRGMCHMHYRRWLYHGDPSIVLRRGGSRHFRRVCRCGVELTEETTAYDGHGKRRGLCKACLRDYNTLKKRESREMAGAKVYWGAIKRRAIWQAMCLDCSLCNEFNGVEACRNCGHDEGQHISV